MPKHPNLVTIRLFLRDETDKELCKKAAKLNKFDSFAKWLRAIINGHLNMMGMRRLKPVSRVKTHCKNGHEFTPENTLIKKQSGTIFMTKGCRQCYNNNRQRYRQRKKEEKLRSNTS